MFDNIEEANSYSLGNKFLMYGIGSIVMIIALPSFLLLIKIAIGVAMALIVTTAIKVASKAISDLLQDNKNKVENQNENIELQDKNNTDASNQGKVGATIIAITALLVGITSPFIITGIGIVTSCAAVTSLVFYECIKNDQMGKNINKEFNEINDRIYDFSIKGIDKIISESKELVK